MSCERKSVVVLGGSGSIGRTICQALATAGYDVHFTYGRSIAVAKALVESIKKMGQRASYQQVECVIYGISGTAPSRHRHRQIEDTTVKARILANLPKNYRHCNSRTSVFELLFIST